MKAKAANNNQPTLVKLPTRKFVLPELDIVVEAVNAVDAEQKAKKLKDKKVKDK